MLTCLIISMRQFDALLACNRSSLILLALLGAEINRIDGKLTFPRNHTQSCKSMLWTTCLAGQPTRYVEMLEAALQSAFSNAPSVLPLVIVDPSFVNETRVQKLFDNIRYRGGILAVHELTFVDDFDVNSHQYTVRGTYMRLEIGLVIEDLVKQGKLDPSKVDVEYVLYADTDVLFLQDINSCSLHNPSIALIGPEFIRGQLGDQANAGVIYINVTAWNRHHSAIIEHGRSGKWEHVALDQGLIKSYYRNLNLEALPDGFNWKG